MPATQETGRELWCLAEDEFRPFLIRIPPTRYVYDLEELVVAKCTVDRLRDLDPRDVILMKIDVDYLANRTEISSGLFRPNPHDEGVKVLDNPMEAIVEVWPTAPRKGIVSVFIYPRWLGIWDPNSAR